MSTLQVANLRNQFIGPISFELGPGECLCVSGPSGAGKTVLLRAIADLDVHLGDVSLDGNPQGRCPGSQWRRQVALLPAESAWWHERVGEHFVDGVDSGLLARLGFKAGILKREVSGLSTGERQRLALVRALARRPWALLLDEPTASLDPKNTQRVEALIAAYRKAHDVPVLWVTHDAGQGRRVGDRCVRLVRGRLRSERAR